MTTTIENLENTRPMIGKNKIKLITPHLRKAIELQNQARSATGLPLIEIKIRRCLVCEQHFESTGKRSCGCISRQVTMVGGREVI